MLFLKEYTRRRKTAHVFKRQEQEDYIVMCYDNGEESESTPFSDEAQAETYAEDFVEKSLTTNQQSTVTRGCCD